MKKTVAFLVAVLVLSQLSTTTVSALEIVVDSKGATLIYQDGVLGDTTENEERPDQMPMKTISPQQDKMLRVRNSGDEKSVEVINKRLDKKQDSTKMDSERLKLQMKANPDREKKESSRSGERREMKKEVTSDKVEQRLEERKERSDEKIELRRATIASESALELRTRNARAVVPNQREIVIDPETNEVGIVLPNGDIKALNHLPDQAQARIEELVQNSEGLELTTLEDGRVVYTTTVQKPYRFLGLFRRQIPTKVTLDDSSGEMTEEKTEASGFGGFLNALSF